MLYINNPKLSYVTYDEAVAAAINNGVNPKTAYLYLMALGVKGVKARQISDDFANYAPIVNMARYQDNSFITLITPCDHCNGMVIKTD